MWRIRPAGAGARLGALALVVVLATGLAAMLAGSPTAPPSPATDIPLAAVPRLDRPLRLAVMGTSLSARYRWPQALAAELSSCLPQPVVLRVFAEPGVGSAWAPGVVEEVARFAPDLVLIEFLANDSDLRQMRSVSGSRATHRGLIQALRAGGSNPAIALMTMNPAFGLRGLMRPRLGAFEAMYAELAREMGTGLIDVAARWRDRLRTADHAALLPDGLHPTDAAATGMMLRAVVPAVAAALAGAWPACASLEP